MPALDCWYFFALWTHKEWWNLIRQEAPSANGHPPEPVLQAPKSPAWLSDDSERSQKNMMSITIWMSYNQTLRYASSGVQDSRSWHSIPTRYHVAWPSWIMPSIRLWNHPSIQLYINSWPCISSLTHGCAWWNNLLTEKYPELGVLYRNCKNIYI